MTQHPDFKIVRAGSTSGDGDILAVCSNCGQWIRASNGNDCLHQCIAQGFADPVQESEPGEPDNSDEEPDQLQPGD